MQKKNDRLYRSIFRGNNLHTAWLKVRQNGLRALSSDENKTETINFDNDSNKNIHKIKELLKKKAFRFLGSKGVVITKESGNQRPIVVQPIPNRIVQRAILNTLLNQKHIKKTMQKKYNFGGVPGRNTEQAFEAIHKSIKKGAIYYLRSDIKDFFTKIPKNKIIDEICSPLLPGEEEFKKFFIDAVKVELENMAKLNKDIGLFPLHEEGVAQGSSLSPLMANVYLHEFDEMMNKDGVVCIRFMDDFVLLGKTEKELMEKFRKGKEYLKKDRLELHSPQEKNSPKAGIGKIKKGFVFLGCKVDSVRITPTDKSIEKIALKIETICNDSISSINKGVVSSSQSYPQTLVTIANIWRGWLKQYTFCNDEERFQKFDRRIKEIISKYEKNYMQIIRRKPKTKFQSLGFTFSDQIDFKPIAIEKSQKKILKKKI